MTLQNTQLLKPAEYLKSDFIKTNPAFKDENGSFSEDKFKDYYKKRVQDFGAFQQEEASQGPALDMFDIDRTPKSKTHHCLWALRLWRNKSSYEPRKFGTAESLAQKYPRYLQTSPHRTRRHS